MNGVLIIFIITLITSCVNFAPKFERPKSSVVKSIISDKTQKISQTVNLMRWQDFFVDDELINLIQLALVNNKELKIAIANIMQAKALYNIKQASQYPSAQINTTFSRTSNSKNIINGNPQNINNSYNIELGLLAYEFDFWGRVHNLKEVALNNYLATLSAQQAIKIAVISTTAETFYNLIIAYERLLLLNNNFAIEIELLELIQLRQNAGLATKLDLTTAQIKLAELNLIKINAKKLVSKYKITLELLIGKPLENIAAITTNTRKTNTQLFSLIIPDNLSTDVLLNRPDVITSEHQLKAANANIGVARAMFFPKINLVASIGLQSSELSNLFKTDSQTWRFSPYTSIAPLFNSSTQSSLEANKAAKDKMIASYENTIEKAFLEVYLNLQDKQFNQQMMKTNKELVEIKQQRLKLIQLKYEQGLANHITVLEAEQKLLNSKIEQLTILKNQITTSISLYKSLGGGK